MSPTVASRPTPTRSAQTKEAVERMFSIDLRSLAVFRIGTGLLLLYDLIVRATHMEAHYTDAGVLPRTVLDELSNLPLLSLHVLSGSAAWQTVLFVVAAVAAVCLVVGYRSRAVAFASWLLLLSLHVRNPYVLNSGDALLLNLMMWATLLPLGRHWSIDARKRGAPESPRIISIATAGILLQVCVVYFASVFHKTAPEWVGEFTAVYYALSLDAYATSLGALLAGAPMILLGAATIATLMLEVCGPMFALSPIQNDTCRGMSVAVFTLFHVGLAATLELGLFSFVCMAGWMLFLPSGFWNRWTIIRGVESARPATMHLSRVGIIAAAAVASICGMLSVAAISPRAVPAIIEPVTSAAEMLRIRQSWRMFAPRPAVNDGWYAMTGILKDGTEVNLFDDSEEPVSGKPAAPAETYVDQRWRKFLFDHFRAEKWAMHRSPMVDFLVSRWNHRHPDRPIESAEIRIINEPSGELGSAREVTEEVLAIYP